MSKAKVAKKSTFIDMTPMVDLAFLLITFFMLTIKFTKQETEKVTIPASTIEKAVPAKDLLTIYANKDGQVRVGITEQGELAKTWLERMATLYNIKFTAEQYEAFSVLSEVPVPIERLPQYLSADPEQRKAIYKQTQGVPMDTVNTRNQLDDWIFEARKVKNQYHQLNPEATTKDFRLAIKADRDTPYPIIQRITEVLKGQQANKFSLITDKKATPK